MKSSGKLVIFDCDGTLVDSQHMIIAAMQATLSSAGLPAEDDIRIRSTVGLSVREAIAALRPDEKEGALVELATIFKREFYRLRVEEAASPDPLYAGTREILGQLRESGFILGVATGNSRRGLDRVIEEHNLEGFFTTLQTADGHPSKPHPSMIQTAALEAGVDPEACIMVGDTSYDMMMARSAGSLAVGVRWGYHSAHELSQGGAHHLLDAFDQLAPIATGHGTVEPGKAAELEKAAEPGRTDG